jgi:hypothetical protein
MIPHMPWHYLADGRTYDGPVSRSRDDDGWWTQGALSTVNAQQRLMMQVAYADSYVAALLDQLRADGMLDEAMLVVVSDHGIDVRPGRQRRGSGGEATEAADAVLPVPLFVKYPGQAAGSVDARDTQTIDLLPTIADAVEVELPPDWTFEGRSLTDEPVQDRSLVWLRGGRVLELERDPDPEAVAGELEAVLGEYRGAHDLFAVGPHWQLLGQPVADADDAPATATIEDRSPSPFEEFDAEAGPIPALFVGEVDGLADGEWVALAVDGTVAGLGPVFTDHSGESVVEIMVDPALLDEEGNALTAFEIDEARGLLPVDGP